MNLDELTSRQKARIEQLFDVYASKTASGYLFPFLDNAPCTFVVDRLASDGKLIEHFDWEWHQEAHHWFDTLAFEARSFLDLFIHSNESSEENSYVELGLIPPLENGTYVEYLLVPQDQNPNEDFELITGPGRLRHRPIWCDLAFVISVVRSHQVDPVATSSMDVSIRLSGIEMHQAFVAFYTDNEAAITQLFEGKSALCMMDLPFDDVKDSGADPVPILGFLGSYCDSQEIHDLVVAEAEDGLLDIGFEIDIQVEGKPPLTGHSLEYKLLSFFDQFVSYLRDNPSNS